MKPTKKYIADKALHLFNQKGFVNIRLQHIADAAFVSVGHLAYHFKTKDAIIEFIYEELRLEQELIMAQFRVVPLFEDINLYFKTMYSLQLQYSFFYLDTLELMRAYPSIRERHLAHINWKLQQIALMINFNISRGTFIDMSAEIKTHLAWQLRAIADNWQYIHQTSMSHQGTEQLFMHQLWGCLAPFFTSAGKREFEQLNYAF